MKREMNFRRNLKIFLLYIFLAIGCQRSNSLQEEHKNEVRVEEEKDTEKHSNVFVAPVKFLRESEDVKDRIYELFRTGGILEKHGFFSAVENIYDSERLIKSKCFKSYASLEQEMTDENSTETVSPTKNVGEILKSSIGTNSSVNIAMDCFMSASSKMKAIAWIKEQRRDKIDDQPGELKDCKVRFIIEYNCCIKTVIPDLSPEYAEIRVRIG